MIRITFVDPTGARTQLEAPTGGSLMRVATAADSEYIAADCGGCLTCATCHVYVDDAWAAKLPAPKPDEMEMLTMTAAERRAGSRLSCQILLDATMDGLVVHLPDTQY